MPWASQYADLQQLRSYLRISDTDDDAELNFAIEAASRAVDQATNRQFGVTTSEARVYTAEFDRRRGHWIIQVDDTETVSPTINIDDDDDQVFDKTIDSFRMFPFDNDVKGEPFTHIFVKSDSTNFPTRKEGAVQVTALWGWSTVPDAVTEATLLQAARFFQRRSAPFGIAGSPDLGNELRLLNKVDPDVDLILRPFRRWWGAA